MKKLIKNQPVIICLKIIPYVLVWVNNRSFLSGVLEEAEFYNITDLIRLVKEKIKEKHVKMSKVSFIYVLWQNIFHLLTRWVINFLLYLDNFNYLKIALNFIIL